MFIRKPINFFLAIFIALGLFLSPFSMKHSFSASKSSESVVMHCMESDSIESLNDVKKTSQHHQKKSDNQTKKLGSCCVAACAAIIATLPYVNFNLPPVKSLLVIANTKALSGMRVEGLVRPPKSLS